MSVDGQVRPAAQQEELVQPSVQHASRQASWRDGDVGCRQLVAGVQEEVDADPGAHFGEREEQVSEQLWRREVTQLWIVSFCATSSVCYAFCNLDLYISGFSVGCLMRFFSSDLFSFVFCLANKVDVSHEDKIIHTRARDTVSFLETHKCRLFLL